MKKIKHRLRDTEIEVKYKLKDKKVVLDWLNQNAKEIKNRYMDRTYSLWDRIKALSRMGVFVRTRQEGSKHTFTIKTRDLKLVSRYAERTEYNLEIEDASRMAEMLRMIGLEDMRILEKYRTMWKYKVCIIVIDETPIGDFIEIEGPKQNLEELIKILKLKGKRITQAYWDVYRDYCRKKGIDEENNLVFN